MAVIRVFKYFAIASLFNANLICGSIGKQYLRSNAPINLFDLLQGNDVGIKRVDSNEAEDIIKSIVKHNRVNNDRPRIIPLNNIAPPDYELENNEINENAKNYGTEDLLENLLSDTGKINSLISQDYELEIGFPKSDKKYKNSAIPPDYELIINSNIPSDYELVKDGKLQDLIPPDHELARNEKLQDLIPPDHELARNEKLQVLIPTDHELVRDGKLQVLIPPDHELVRDGKLQVLIPPDHELVRNEKLQVLIPPDHELVRNSQLQDFIPPDHELTKKSNIPPDHEFVRYGKLKGEQGLLDYEFIKNNDVRPEINSLLNADYDLADIYGRPKIYLDNLGNDLSDLRKIITTRLVSSYNKSPLIGQDSKNNVYFKPLIKLPNRHLIKPESDYDDDDLILIRSPNDEDEDVYAKFGLYKQRYTNNKKKNAKQYTPLTYKEGKITTNLIKHIQYLVTKIQSPMLKKLALMRVMSVLQKIDNLREGAEKDHKPRKPGPLSAYVPFFNYWTYQKNIVEDDCPKDSVKIGNVCSRTPPH